MLALLLPLAVGPVVDLRVGPLLLPRPARVLPRPALALLGQLLRLLRLAADPLLLCLDDHWLLALLRLASGLARRPLLRPPLPPRLALGAPLGQLPWREVVRQFVVRFLLAGVVGAGQHHRGRRHLGRVLRAVARRPAVVRALGGALGLDPAGRLRGAAGAAPHLAHLRVGLGLLVRPQAALGCGLRLGRPARLLRLRVLLGLPHPGVVLLDQVLAPLRQPLAEPVGAALLPGLGGRGCAQAEKDVPVRRLAGDRPSGLGDRVVDGRGVVGVAALEAWSLDDPDRVALALVGAAPDASDLDPPVLRRRQVFDGVDQVVEHHLRGDHVRPAADEDVRRLLAPLLRVVVPVGAHQVVAEVGLGDVLGQLPLPLVAGAAADLLRGPLGASGVGARGGLDRGHVEVVLRHQFLREPHRGVGLGLGRAPAVLAGAGRAGEELLDAGDHLVHVGLVVHYFVSCSTMLPIEPSLRTNARLLVLALVPVAEGCVVAHLV